ncbi:pyridoxal-phosphate dependent enzyme [Roseovarius sp. EL26]|uniref:pyridoxal-phosphate dependent enzyme n=1 Tax=Roseovarius sp. EL26 TaxID=2126672 RepID=UPI000EA1E983|nr:pyridoxal-phosphate dependent enzyme [Roseovarius sp. EL26]
MDIIENPHRGSGLTDGDLSEIPYPSVNAAAPAELMARCFGCKETPLHALDAFGTKLWVKDERGRMDLGSFKALGAAYVIAHQAAETGVDDLSAALSGRVYVTASAGNHGMSVAAGAAQFGARAVVYLAETVPEGFAERLRGLGADVVRAGAEYEASMAAAQKAAKDNDWTLLSDSSWPGYFELSHRLMEGYTAMAAEAVSQMPEAPTHIMLQAGVGGLAGACAAYFRSAWGNAPRIIVVEPVAAPALKESIEAGHMVSTKGPVSNMGRLDCKEASLIALKGLSRDADAFALISEDEGSAILPKIAALDLASTESGAAGIAALDLMGLGPDARVLCILSEEAEA